MFEPIVSGTIVGLARLLTGVHARWLGGQPVGGPRVDIANHTSHMDLSGTVVLNHNLNFPSRDALARFGFENGLP